MRTAELKAFLLGLVLFAPSVELAAAPDSPATPAAPPGEPVAAKFLLTSKAAVGKDFVFSVKPNRPAAKAEWLALGATIEGYRLAGYDHAVDTLTLEKGDETVRVPLEIATIKTAPITPDASLAERRQRDLERMAAMRPALEGGQPIRGDVVMLVNGEARSQPVELVIGREMRLDAGTDGIYVILPALKPNGTVSYAISLRAKGAGDTLGEVRLRTIVTNTPWSGFSFVTKEGPGFGFVPAMDEPPPPAK